MPNLLLLSVGSQCHSCTRQTPAAAEDGCCSAITCRNPPCSNTYNSGQQGLLPCCTDLYYTARPVACWLRLAAHAYATLQHVLKPHLAPRQGLAGRRLQLLLALLRVLLRGWGAWPTSAACPPVGPLYP